MLPNGYKTPETQGGHYMRFEQGDNKFRVLSDAIVGWEAWTMEKKPVRFKMDDKPENAGQYKDGKVKHFWAFAVWNYATNSVQILQVTQSSIQKAIEGFIADADWGDPKEYDININRTGESLETEYRVAPKPHKPLSDEVSAAYETSKPNLEALFTGDDPFAKVEEKDEIPF